MFGLLRQFSALRLGMLSGTDLETVTDVVDSSAYVALAHSSTPTRLLSASLSDPATAIQPSTRTVQRGRKRRQGELLLHAHPAAIFVLFVTPRRETAA